MVREVASGQGVERDSTGSLGLVPPLPP
jgi:hypothetical protein